MAVVEIELSAEEQDANPVVLEVAEATCRRLEALDLGVQSFSDRIGNVMLKVSQQVVQMTLEHLCHFDNRLEAAAAHPAKPIFEKPLCPQPPPPLPPPAGSSRCWPPSSCSNSFTSPSPSAPCTPASMTPTSPPAIPWSHGTASTTSKS